MHQHYRDNQADALGLVIPHEDSESEDSSPETDEARAGLAHSTTLFGPKKDSFIRRLRRKLRFYLIPRNNVQPPHITMKQKKACLRDYFKVFSIRPEIYREWFTPI